MKIEIKENKINLSVCLNAKKQECEKFWSFTWSEWVKLFFVNMLFLLGYKKDLTIKK